MRAWTFKFSFRAGARHSHQVIALTGLALADACMVAMRAAARELATDAPQLVRVTGSCLSLSSSRRTGVPHG